MSDIARIAVIGKNCVACGRCAKECPVCAISIYKGIYATIGEKCVACGKCVKACPAGLIKFEERGVTYHEEAMV